ncbi:MAG: hypothetical protein PHW83_09885 [Bacteroidales bacterium]|nr:hypothetical protein [Bacteroidales bacterium]
MTANTPKTRKAKDHTFKKDEIAADMIRVLGIEPADIVIPPSSFPGCDLILSPVALAKFPFGIECKRQEKLAVPDWWRQCTRNAKSENLAPLLVFRKNRGDALAVLKWSDLLALLAERCPDQGECPALEGEDAKRFQEHLDTPTDADDGRELIREVAKRAKHGREENEQGRLATREDFNLKQARTDNFLSREDYKMDIGYAEYRDYRNEGGRP